MMNNTVTATRPALLLRYLQQLSPDALNPAATAFYASLDQIATASPTVARATVQELHDQRTNLKLIASENYSSLTTQLAQANLFTDKYAEGYPGHRFYAGCDNVDTIEREAAGLACQLFGPITPISSPIPGRMPIWLLSWRCWPGRSRLLLSSN